MGFAGEAVEGRGRCTDRQSLHEVVDLVAAGQGFDCIGHAALVGGLGQAGEGHRGAGVGRRAGIARMGRLARADRALRLSSRAVALQRQHDRGRAVRIVLVVRHGGHGRRQVGEVGGHVGRIDAGDQFGREWVDPEAIVDPDDLVLTLVVPATAFGEHVNAGAIGQCHGVGFDAAAAAGGRAVACADLIGRSQRQMVRLDRAQAWAEGAAVNQQLSVLACAGQAGTGVDRHVFLIANGMHVGVQQQDSTIVVVVPLQFPVAAVELQLHRGVAGIRPQLRRQLMLDAGAIPVDLELHHAACPRGMDATITQRRAGYGGELMHVGAHRGWHRRWRISH